MTRAQAVRVQEVISRTRIGANKVATAEIWAQQVAPRRDVISSGNSVHVTITIASRGVPLSRDSFRKKICLSSLRVAPPISLSKIGQKPLEMDFDRLFHPPSLPSFLFLLKFSHEKLCKKRTTKPPLFTKRVNDRAIEKDYVAALASAHLPFFGLPRWSMLTMFPAAAVFWFFAARPLCKGKIWDMISHLRLLLWTWDFMWTESIATFQHFQHKRWLPLISDSQPFDQQGLTFTFIWLLPLMVASAAEQ